MPLPMVHLSIAVELFGVDRVSPDFLLGSIAPDAIHMRYGSTADDKDRTHLRDIPGESYSSRLRGFLSKYIASDLDARDFIIGYTIHLWSDYLWITTIGDEFIQNFGNKPNLEFRKLYYNDTEQIDIDLYRACLCREVLWDKLKKAQPRTIGNLLLSNEIDNWRNHVLQWFDQARENRYTEPVLITRAVVDDFVRSAVDNCMTEFPVYLRS